MRGFPIPPPYMPIGLLYVASNMKSKGYNVKLIDLNLKTENDYWEEIKDADVIGFNFLSYVRSQGFRLIEETHIKYPHKQIIAGGAFVSAFTEQLGNKYPYVSFLPGEYDSVTNINDYPYPDWSLSNFDVWDMQIAKSRPNWVINDVALGNARWSPIIASRGCKARCLFCTAYNHWGKRVRFRDGKNIADEIEYLVKEHNVRLFSFDDNAFPLNKKQCMDFCEAVLQRGLKIAWKADTRADVFDREMLEIMYKAGCFMLAIGVESGSPKILKTINKGLNLDKAKEAIIMMKEVGIKAYTLLMVGNPGETEDTIKETVKFLEDTNPNIYSYVTGVMVLPGTGMQRLAGIPDEYYLSGDGLPIYTKEHTMDELQVYSGMISKVPKNY
jgi:radical SAM superfamily enzyme YgiQ (UPF0313 family)